MLANTVAFDIADLAVRGLFASIWTVLQDLF